jgi:hypothetical protein
MAMTETEQMDTFLGLLESHIDPDFAKATNILQFMHYEGIIDFTNLRQNWDGIQGIDPVHVEFTDSLPARLKSATRIIPPSILEVAKKEFGRLLTYFLVPSTSQQLPPTSLLPQRQLPHMFVFVVISESLTNISSPTMGHFLMFDST